MSRAGRRRLRLALAAAGLAALAVAWTGCVSTVTPLPSPAEPVTVYLRHEARHRGLILPRAAGGHVEYGYGDWDWYALQRNRWYHAFDTLLWPTPGTLGRRILPVGTLAELQATYPASVLHPLPVERGAAARLEEELEWQFASGGVALYNPAYGLHFVPHPDRFWLFHNCNDALASWLQALGCRVSPAPVRLGLTVKPAAVEEG